MMRFALGMILSLAFTAQVLGQAAPYNPYAPQVEDALPVAADGTLNWPKFFKSAALESRFQSYFQMGSCVGTRKAINDRLSNNTVDVNKLGEAKIAGVAAAGDARMVAILDAQGKSIAVVAHPGGVTKVNVTGDMSLGDLRPGMTLRLLARLDANGVEHEPQGAIEVITPTKDLQVPVVQADHLQTIVGTIARLHTDHILLKVATGRLRKLSILVDERTTVAVHGATLDLVSAGDRVEAFGHIYSGAGVSAQQAVFASEITVLKRDLSGVSMKPLTTATMQTAGK